MIFLSIPHEDNFITISSFFLESYPLLLKSISFSFLLVFCTYLCFDFQKQNKWLEKNKKLLTGYKNLKKDLHHFGMQMSSCKHCNARDMQLWNFKKHLLVVRCRSCKMNYTFTKEQNNLLLKVLFQIESVTILLNKIIYYRNHAFGRRLAHLLDIDLTKVNASTTPLEILHFTTQNQDLITTDAAKNIEIFECEFVHPQQLELIT